MSSTQVYTTENFEQPIPVQDNFTSHYNLDNPMAALQDYARNMHRHTQTQMERTTRRRTNGTVSPSMPADLSRNSDQSSRASSMNSSASHAALNGYRRSS